MTHGSLFSGIGGFDLAAQWLGWKNVFQCEKDEFCQRILKYHFPKTTLYGDIKAADFTPYRGAVDVISGGFPCQPFSVAGKRKGKEDDRYLWPEMLRAVREVEPAWVVAENVRGLLSQERGVVFERVCADLEAIGYEVQPLVIPACAVGAPHRRERVWLIAHASGHGGQANTKRERGSDGENKEQFERAHHCKAAENSISNGRLQRAPNEERAEVRTKRNAGAGGAIRIRLQAWITSHRANAGLKGVQRAGENGVSKPQAAAHAASLEGNRRGQGGFYAKPAGADDEGHVAHTESQRLSKRNAEQVQHGAYAAAERYNGITSWENFPTQPPVCGGDDGLPRRLDGATFPRWRSESIKSYGNAIVPQVAFEIFKAIEKTHQHHGKYNH